MYNDARKGIRDQERRGNRGPVFVAETVLLNTERVDAVAESGGTKLSIRAPTSGDPLRPSKSCILKRFSTPYIKPFRRHWSVLG